MLRRTNVVFVIVLSAVLVATWTMLGTAVAQKASVPKPQAKQALGEEEVKQLLFLIDTDKKGKISKQEWMKFMEAEFVTQPGTNQWLNPNAFVSTVDPSTGACSGGGTPQNCQFGNLGRSALRGPDFVWSDFYLTKWFVLSERLKLRLDGQFFNLFNHPNFGLPSIVLAGIPGKPSTQTGFGAVTYAVSPPTGLLGVGLGGDSSPRMIALQVRLEF